VTERIDAQLENGGIALIATHQALELRTGSFTTINLGENAWV